MLKYELDTSEIKVFERQGFYVKRVISIKEYFLNIFLLISLTFLLISIWLSFGLVPLMIVPSLFGIFPSDPRFPIFLNIITGILNIYFLIQLYIPFYLQFLRFHKVFYFSKQKFLWQKNLKKSNKKSILSLDYHENLYWEMIQKLDKKNSLQKIIIWIIIPIFLCLSILIWIVLLYDWLFQARMLLNIVYFSLFISFFTMCTPFIRWLFELFNPLYIFRNLWEKIQSLTPQIEEKSQEIQKNFQSDMNFRVLSDGFDSLSKIFSQIISLVIKLEWVEKRANKGNIFDSEKYINLLRSDIVEPLKSLRSFLEKQKEQLAVTLQELQKVRIGKQTEFSSWSALSSKRSESLLTELTENIVKLDQMIGKMEEKK